MNNTSTTNGVYTALTSPVQEKSQSISKDESSKSLRGRPRKVSVAETKTPVCVKTEDENSMTSMSESSKMESTSNSKEQTQEEEESSASQRRQRGRPRKAPKLTMKRPKDHLKGVCMDNLDLLHRKTLESIDYDRCLRRPPAGCVDQKLCTAKGDSYKGPPIVVTNEELIATDSENVPLLSPGSEFLPGSLVKNPKGYQVVNCSSVEEFLNMIKYSLQKLQETLKSDQYKESLNEQVALEEVSIYHYNKMITLSDQG